VIQQVDTPPADGDNLINACDSHIHIFDRRFKQTLAADDMSAVATTADDYRQVQPCFGTTRTVVVTPRNYDVDNAVTLDAISQLGIERARGVATIRPDITDAQLEALHAGGIRGIRFTLYTPDDAPTSFDMVETLSHRVHELGWHLQLHWTAAQIVEHRDLVDRLRTEFVFDHLARLPVATGLDHPARALVDRWLTTGRAWLKLSAPYLDSMAGETEVYPDIEAIARHWVDLAPDRLVWGSDWPHTSVRPGPKPAKLISCLNQWTETAAIRRRILVDNPATLYGFKMSS
jgi:D-galactarolactone isomerase